MAESSVQIRPDIFEKHRSLFGEKTANGRRVTVEHLIAQLFDYSRLEYLEQTPHGRSDCTPRVSADR